MGDRSRSLAAQGAENYSRLRMLLTDLTRGHSARVVSIRAERSVATRLMELGLLPGGTVRLVRVAPLGDPLVIAVRGAELSVRASEARHIEIEPSA